MVLSEYLRCARLRPLAFGARKQSCADFLIMTAILSMALLSGCGGKTPVAKAPPAPPPPPPAAPTARIEANPASVDPGQQVTITWKTENADAVNIDQIGSVAANGSQNVSPTDSTTYRLTAKGPGGVSESSATVTVARAAANELPALDEKDLEDGGSGRLDVFFDYNDFSIRPDQQPTVKNDADFLKQHPGIFVVVEGHCDELGSTEYNLALGAKRATQVKFALVKAGVSDGRIEAVSYGKEKPFCEEESEACWRQNRRVHIQVNLDR
jgi:peptidoglycan-associated lipoprotein